MIPSVYPGYLNSETTSLGFLLGVSGLPLLAGKTREIVFGLPW